MTPAKLIITYGDVQTEIPPATAARVRRYAERNGVPVEEAVVDLLRKAEHVGELIFLPVRASSCQH